MDTEIIAEAMLGKDAEEFIQSDIGRYLVGCADQEIEEAVTLLKTVAPWRMRRIRELQNRIYRAESFKTWMYELVIKGRQALQQMEED